VGTLPAQDWTLRVTLVFRRDDGDWRLVHRHADPLAKGISLEEAGRITLGKAAARGAVALQNRMARGFRGSR
jgi:hypothetical protein